VTTEKILIAVILLSPLWAASLHFFPRYGLAAHARRQRSGLLQKRRA
jgi:hypothetical protein